MIAAKHYQIMTKGRLASGMNQAWEALDNLSFLSDKTESQAENALNRVQESVHALHYE